MKKSVTIPASIRCRPRFSWQNCRISSRGARRGEPALRGTTPHSRDSARSSRRITDPANEHIFHQYTIRAERRDDLRAHLQAKSIGCMIYYPIALAPAALFCESRLHAWARSR